MRMRHAFIALAFLTLEALIWLFAWAAMAHADPVTGAITTALAGALNAGAIGTALIGFGVNLVAAYAVSAIGGAAQQQGSSGTTLSNFIDSTAPAEVVYGRVRKGGPITFLETYDTNHNRLYATVVLAGHELDAIEDVYIDDELVPLDTTGRPISGKWLGTIRFEKYLGTATQAAPQVMLDNLNSVDANFRGRGLAYLLVEMYFHADDLAGGLPVITAVVRGKKVYDPRSGLTQWTANAALCIRDYITSSDGVGDPKVDDAVFAAQATICDEVMTLADGSTEKRYEINGAIQLADDRVPGDVLVDMTKSCAGILGRGPSGWQLKVGHYSGVVGSLGLDDLRSKIAIEPRTEMSQSFNQVQGSFADAAQDWVETDYPLLSVDAYRGEDGGESVLQRLDLPFTTSSAAAQRLAALFLNRSREQIKLTVDVDLGAFEWAFGDIIALTIARYGWVAKEFEILEWNFVPGEAPVITLSLQEVSSTVYSTAPNIKLIQSNNSNLAPWSDVAPVSIAVASELRLQNEIAVGVMALTLTAGLGYISRYEAQYRPTGTTNWRGLGQSSDGLFEVVHIVDGTYDVRAWAISPFGNKGSITTLTGIEVMLFGPAPANVANFTGNVVGDTLFLAWDAVPDLDLSHYHIRYSSKTSGASYESAIDLIQKVPRPATTAQVPAKTGTYFIKAVDKIGGVSASAASVVIVDDAGDILPKNVIATLAMSPAFAGTKTHTTATSDDIGPYLVLDTVNLFDAHAGLFDDALGLFDGGDGSIWAEGYLYPGTVIDMGIKATARVDATLDVGLKLYSDFFDSAQGLFDDRPGVFDGDPTAFDDCFVDALIATTNDNPSGSPVWSAWKAFVRTTVTARAMKFALRLRTSDVSATPIVRAATVVVDMPDRTETGTDITFTGSYTVTYGAPFAAAPAVSVSLSMANGDRYVLSAKTRSGFTITVYTGAVVSTNPATFDFVAKGYGKELL